MWLTPVTAVACCDMKSARMRTRNRSTDEDAATADHTHNVLELMQAATVRLIPHAPYSYSATQGQLVAGPVPACVTPSLPRAGSRDYACDAMLTGAVASIV